MKILIQKVQMGPESLHFWQDTGNALAVQSCKDLVHSPASLKTGLFLNMEILYSEVVGRDKKKKVFCARTAKSRKLCSGLLELLHFSLGANCSSRLFRCLSAPKEPTNVVGLGLNVAARAVFYRCTGCGQCVSFQCVGSLLRQLVTLQGVRRSEVQDGNSAKPPSCKIKGLWCSQGCTVVMLQEAGCCLKSMGSNIASLVFNRDLGGPSQTEGSAWKDWAQDRITEWERCVTLCHATFQWHFSRIPSHEIESSSCYSHHSKVFFFYSSYC